MSKNWTTFANCTGTFNSCPLKENTTTKRNSDSIECTYKSNIYNACSTRFTVKKKWGLEDAKGLGMVNMVCACNSSGVSLTKTENNLCYYGSTDTSGIATTPGSTNSKVNGISCTN